jgi:hypothetical protein
VSRDRPPRLGSLAAAFRAECRWTLRPPFSTPIAIATNGLLMVTAWFLLPRSWLFHYTNTPAFPLALASWMYSDVSATNVLTGDASRTARSLNDADALLTMLRAKSFVLWLLVAPICTVLTLFIDFGEHRWYLAVATILAVAIVPFGSLGIAGWVGVRFPYHARPLRWRWEHRQQRSSTLRWLALVFTPYWLVPGLTLLILSPTLLLWTVMSPDHNLFRVTIGWFSTGIVLACLVAGLSWGFGHRAAVRCAIRRRAQLAEYLTEPHRG